MSLSESKCWYSKSCLHFFKCLVPLVLMRFNGVNEIKQLNLIYKVGMVMTDNEW